jgi:UDP-GlcNAc3NAcA epimerase
MDYILYKMKIIVTVVGARPQFIKAAVVSRVIREFRYLKEIIVHTGQHYDENMSDIFFDELDIPKPDYNLSIGSGTHGQNTGRMIEAIERVLIDLSPALVLVYGDTNTTLAAAVAASKLHIPIAHVEAGLRSFNRRMPEEINRVLTDHVSSLLFTPSNVAVTNLFNEGINGSKVVNVGDVMYDAAKFYLNLAEKKSRILKELGLEKGRYVLLTMHRQENTDDAKRLKGIFEGLSIADLPIIWPVHPRTSKMLKSFGIKHPDNIRMIDPVGYLDMVILEKNARLIVTDSGGVQKEAFYHGIPSLILRDETEWLELVDLGVTKIVGANPDLIRNGIRADVMKIAPENSVYGSGNAGCLIVDELIIFLK